MRTQARYLRQLVQLLATVKACPDPARARELKIEVQLLKPVQQYEMLESICRVMAQTGVDSMSAAPTAGEEWQAPAPAATPLRVLLAEDNELNAHLLEKLLGRQGHHVRLASNGREALSLVRQGSFDLLLLDIHMPELDGLQVAQAVRESERTAGGHLPIIALTAGARKQDRKQCLAAGMDDYLAKPIRPADLWAAIDRVVTARSQRSEARDQKHDGGASLTSDLCPLTSDSGLLAPRVLLDACGDDEATLEELCQTFRACLPDHLQAVRDALRDADAPRLREVAHKLAGMVAMFSTGVSGVASQLEDHAALGRVEEARPLVTQLDAMAEDLIKLVGGLTLETLRDQAGRADEPGRTAGP
ncbi:MAG: response regulator [Thermoguttaceae bacterium]